MGKGSLDVPSGGGSGYYGSGGRMSRGSSSQSIPSILAPHSMLMQRRIQDIENGFKQLDKITDEIDYDIETFESKYEQIYQQEPIRTIHTILESEFTCQRCIHGCAIENEGRVG